MYLKSAPDVNDPHDDASSIERTLEGLRDVLIDFIHESKPRVRGCVHIGEALRSVLLDCMMARRVNAHIDEIKQILFEVEFRNDALRTVIASRSEEDDYV